MTNDELLLWGFGLIGVAFALAMAEMFVPSGGVIAVVSVLMAGAGVVAFWRVSWVWGMTSLVGTVAGGIGVFNLAIRVFPHTPMGRHLILGNAEPEESLVRRAQEEKAVEESARAIVGATGTALTDLRPVGIAEISGRRMEVLAEGGIIDRGNPVRVSGVEDGQVRVRPLRA